MKQYKVVSGPRGWELVERAPGVPDAVIGIYHHWEDAQVMMRQLRDRYALTWELMRRREEGERRENRRREEWDGDEEDMGPGVLRMLQDSLRARVVEELYDEKVVRRLLNTL